MLGGKFEDSVESAAMFLYSLGGVIFGEKKVLDWLKGKGLLASTEDCEKCNNGTAMVFTARTEQGGSKDGYTHDAVHNAIP